MNRQVVPVLLLLALLPLLSQGEVGSFEFKVMIRDASAILIGAVEATDGENATIKVIEVLKGTPGEIIRLNVEKNMGVRHFTCGGEGNGASFRGA